MSIRFDRGRLRPRASRTLASIGLCVLFAAAVSPRTAGAEPPATTETGPRDAAAAPGPVSRWNEATPEERRALREDARRRWQEATPRERRAFLRAMRGLARALPDFSVIEHRLLIRQMAAMSASERQAWRTRLRRIDSLEPAERRELIGELRALLDESPEDAARIERNLERWRRMPEAERERYREQMRRFRDLPIEERQRLLDDWSPNDPER